MPLPIRSSLGQVEAANSAIFGTRVRVGEIADYVMNFVDREVWPEAERARRRNARNSRVHGAIDSNSPDRLCPFTFAFPVFNING